MSLKALFPGFLMLLTLSGLAQSNTEEKYSQSPVWIQMMDDPKVNYYEAVKAYETYWKSHTKPLMEEEEEMEGENESNRERKREIEEKVEKDKGIVLTEEQIKKKNEDEVMKYNVKRFEQWKREVAPYVQDDGRILSDEERKAIWQKEQDELKNSKK